MNFSMRSTVEYPVHELAALFNHAFTGYIGGTVQLDANSMAGMFARDNIDLALSRVLIHDETPIGIILLARQGWTARVAAMGIVPDAQNKGVGRWFIEAVMQEARQRGERHMVLEAFEQNTRAVKLYERVGFKIVRRLYGYTFEHMHSEANDLLQEIDCYDMAQVIFEHGADDLPWQISGTAVARFAPPTRAYKLGHAYAAIVTPTPETIVLRALVTITESLGEGHATNLLHAIAAKYPGRRWSIPPLCPEEYGVSFFEKRGFSRMALNQVQMACTL